MDFTDPLARPKADYRKTIAVIQSEKSEVGIDAQYTHAIVIEYLKQIAMRLEKLERILEK